MKNFALKTALGFLVRLLLIVPFALLLINMGEYSTINNNISVFVAIVVGIASVLYLGIMIFVPAEYAIKTNIEVIEFQMYKPQIVTIFASATIALALAIAMAVFAFYYTAIVLLVYSMSLYIWPKYIKKIDIASKDHMIESLKS